MTRTINDFFNAVSHVELTQNMWNSQKMCGIHRKRVEFAFQHAIHPTSGIRGKDVEFTEMAWNSRISVESAGVFLVMHDAVTAIGSLVHITSMEASSLSLPNAPQPASIDVETAVGPARAPSSTSDEGGSLLRSMRLITTVTWI